MLSSAGSMLLCLGVSMSQAGPVEWGGFRGNNGTGIATAGTIPEALDPDSNLKWRTEVPAAPSSPTIAAGRVFITGAEPGALITMSLDRRSGEILWRRELECEWERPGSGFPAAPSPVTDGERVYVVFHHLGLITFAVDGEELWRADLGPLNIPHGMSASPLVHDGRLFLLADQDTGAFLIAMDARSGEELWRTDRHGTTHGYSTPSLFLPEDGEAQIVVSGSFEIVGYSLASGRRLWWVDGAAWQAKATPVIEGDLCVVNSFTRSPFELGVPRFGGTFDELLEERDADRNGLIGREEWDDPKMQEVWFVLDLDGDDMLGRRDWDHALVAARAMGGLFAIRLGGEGELSDDHVEWFIDDRRSLPEVPSPLLLDGRVYLIRRGGVLSSLDRDSGEVIQRGRIGTSDDYYASLVAAGGRILAASRSGQLTVIRAGEEWEQLSSHQLDEFIFSTPAIADGQVFVRTQRALYCFGASD